MRPASPFLVLAAFGLLGAPLAALPAAWPCLQGDAARSGRGPALGLPVQELWRAKLDGSLYSSPAVAEGLVVLGSSDRRVSAYDLASGTLRWRQELPDRVWGSGPAIDGGRVFIGCVDGCVHALSLQDGALQASYCAQRKGYFGERPDVLSSPLVVDGRLFFGSDNHDIYGWDLQGRRDLWRVATGDILHDNSAAACGGRVYFPSRDGALYAMDAADGTLRWRFERKKAFNSIPTCDAQSVYIGNADGAFYALRAEDGVLRWSFQTRRGIMSSAALGPDGSVVFGSADGKVYSLDAATGRERWSHKTGDLVLASPLITGALVWVGSYDDNFYALDLASGEERYRTKLKGGVFTSAAAAGDKILVAGRDGDLLCLQATPAP
jgi:outer membrane protein assembly factor BamB